MCIGIAQSGKAEVFRFLRTGGEKPCDLHFPVARKSIKETLSPAKNKRQPLVKFFENDRLRVTIPTDVYELGLVKFFENDRFLHL